MAAVWVRGGGAGAWEEARLVVVAVAELEGGAWGLFIVAGRRWGWSSAVVASRCRPAGGAAGLNGARPRSRLVERRTGSEVVQG